MTNVSEVTLHAGDARCIYCIQGIKETEREFDLDPSDTDLSRLPVAVFNVGAAGYEGEPVCASHVADALLETLV
jgi:hypothetical protein